MYRFSIVCILCSHARCHSYRTNIWIETFASVPFSWSLYQPMPGDHEHCLPLTLRRLTFWNSKRLFQLANFDSKKLAPDTIPPPPPAGASKRKFETCLPKVCLKSVERCPVLFFLLRNFRLHFDVDFGNWRFFNLTTSSNMLREKIRCTPDVIAIVVVQHA